MFAKFCDILRRLAQRELPSHDQLTKNELMAEAYQPAEGFVDEVWRPVPGWEGVYMVSDQGRVRSLDRVCIRSGGKGNFVKKGAVLRAESVGKRQCLRVKLQVNGESEYFYVHDLVLRAFAAPCSVDHKVCHLDGDPNNNSINNLKCVKIPCKLEVAHSKKERQLKAAKIKAFKKELDSAIRKAHGYVPSRTELDAAFAYRDGTLYWKEDRGNHIKAGTRAGSIRRKGYVFISFKGRIYPAHRLIWAMHGNPPAETIDHINRDPSDNRIENLRAATKNEQLFNTGLRPDNKSGIKGVSWHRITNTWRGQVCFQGKAYSAGYFSSKEKCGQAVQALRDRLHGEFAHHAIAT
jgi:hypothetical protein